MSRYKLTYFDFRGRADLIRLLFVAGKVDFEDVRISFEEWPALKESKLRDTVFILLESVFFLGTFTENLES